MASETVSFETLMQWLGHVGQITDFTVALERCLVAIKADTKEHFANSSGPDGQPWKPLLFKRPNSKGNDKPLRNRGLLMASVTARGQGHIENVGPTEAEVGTNLEYAQLQQEGGIVRPTKAKALAIPLTKEAARAGSPRNMPGLFPIRGGGGLFSAAEKGRGKNKRTELTKHFLFAKQATIPARPFLGFSEKLKETCGQIIQDFVADKINE